jgi:hypothetical protein
MVLRSLLGARAGREIQLDFLRRHLLDRSVTTQGMRTASTAPSSANVHGSKWGSQLEGGKMERTSINPVSWSINLRFDQAHLVVLLEATLSTDLRDRP